LTEINKFELNQIALIEHAFMSRSCISFPGMPSPCKAVLLFLLMLTVPAQGFAASAMFFCGTAHQRIVFVQDGARHSAHGPGDALLANHEEQSQSANSMASVSTDSIDEATDLLNVDNASGKAGQPGTHKCSACAGCCVNAAIAASNLKYPLAEHAVRRDASRLFQYAGFVKDGPKRPPRSFLA